MFKVLHVPENSITIIYNWFNSVAMLVDCFRDIQCGKHRYEEEPDGGFSEMLTRTFSGKRVMSKSGQHTS